MSNNENIKKFVKEVTNESYNKIKEKYATKEELEKIDTTNFLSKEIYDSDNDGIVDKANVAKTLEIVKTKSPIHVLGTHAEGNFGSIPQSLKDMQYESKNRQLDYGMYGVSSDITIEKNNGKINLDIKFNGNLDLIDGSIILKKGRIYNILVSNGSKDVSSYTAYGIFLDNDNISKGSYSNFKSGNGIAYYTTEKFEKDTLMDIKSVTGSSFILDHSNFFVMVQEIGYARDESLVQVTKLNVNAGDPISVNSDVDLTDGKVIDSCLKFVEGEENVVKVLKSFDNTQENSFYYNKDEVEFIEGMSIKKSHIENSTLNSDGFYEIDLSKYIEINSIRSEVNE